MPVAQWPRSPWAKTARRRCWKAVGLLAAITFLVLPITEAFNVRVDIGQQICFHENVEKGGSFVVVWEVGAGGQLDIDFTLADPRGSLLVDDKLKSSGLRSIEGSDGGRYDYCFRNVNGSRQPKVVTFNIHKKKPNADMNLTPLSSQIEELKAMVDAITDGTEYMILRERSHRNTAESTNSRVVWWSLTQTAVLVAVCFFQIWYIRRFFEVKTRYTRLS